MSNVHRYGRPLFSCAGLGSILLGISVASCSSGGESAGPPSADTDLRSAETSPEHEVADPIVFQTEEKGKTQKVGLVALDDTHDIVLAGGGGSASWSVLTRFSDVGAMAGEPYSPGSGHIAHQCKHANLGAGCSLFQCARTDPGPPTLSAGDITVTGGVPTRIDLSYDPSGVYYGWSTEPGTALGLFRAGNELVFHSEGSKDIPSFDARLRAPDDLIITHPVSPPTPSDGGIPIFELDRWKPAKFTWTAPTRGAVRVEIYHRYDGALEAESGIRCDFPAAARQGTIPLSVLRHVNQKQAWIQVRGHEETTVRAGDYDVRIMAAGEGKSPEGYLFPRDFNWR